MKRHIWEIIEVVYYILKIIADYYDKRTEKSQPAEHQA
jgi:hypothetical protein